MMPGSFATGEKSTLSFPVMTLEVPKRSTSTAAGSSPTATVNRFLPSLLRLAVFDLFELGVQDIVLAAAGIAARRIAGAASAALAWCRALSVRLLCNGRRGLRQRVRLRLDDV